jgi:hypothetical protein
VTIRSGIVGLVSGAAMAGPVELMQQIADISLRQKALQEKLRPITARLAAGITDPALGQENNRLQKEIADLEERKARLLRG